MSLARWLRCAIVQRWDVRGGERRIVPPDKSHPSGLAGELGDAAKGGSEIIAVSANVENPSPSRASYVSLVVLSSKDMRNEGMLLRTLGWDHAYGMWGI